MMALSEPLNTDGVSQISLDVRGKLDDVFDGNQRVVAVVIQRRTCAASMSRADVTDATGGRDVRSPRDQRRAPAAAAAALAQLAEPPTRSCSPWVSLGWLAATVPVGLVERC
jgi:hypothetical protein